MRIAIVSERFHPLKGGTETRWLEVSKRLAKDHEIHVYTINGDITQGNSYKFAEYEYFNGINIHRSYTPTHRIFTMGMRPLNSCLGFGISCGKKLFKEKFDLIDFNSFPLIHIPPAKFLSKDKTVISWHEVWGKDWLRYGSPGFIAEWFERFVAVLDWKKHIVVSDFTANRLNKILNVDKEKITVVPNGVNPNFFGNYSKEKGKIIFVGRLSRDKQAHDLLIDAFINAQKSLPWLSLCIIGNGPMLPMIRQKAQQLKNVQVYVDLPIEGVINHVRSSSIACFLSEYEGDGIAAKETLAAGCPVVTANFELNAIARNLIIDDFNGYITEPTPERIAEGILNAFENWNKLHPNCSDSVKRFSWDETAKRLEGIYEEVAS